MRDVDEVRRRARPRSRPARAAPRPGGGAGRRSRRRRRPDGAHGVEQRVARAADHGDPLDAPVRVARRTARPARSRAARARRRRRTRRSVVGSGSAPTRPMPVLPGHDASSSTSNAGSSYGCAARSAATTAARDRRGATISTRASTTRAASPADPIVGVAAGDGVNVPSPVDVHAHRVYSPTRPAPAAARASTSRSASPTGTNTTCLSSGLGGRGVQGHGADEPERVGQRVRDAARRGVGVGVRREQRDAGADQPVQQRALEAWSRRSSGPAAAAAGGGSRRGRPPTRRASSTTAATGSTANSTRRTGCVGVPGDEADRVPRLGGGRRVPALEQVHDVGQAGRAHAQHATGRLIAPRPGRRPRSGRCARGPSGCRTTARRPTGGAGASATSGSRPFDLGVRVDRRHDAAPAQVREAQLHVAGDQRRPPVLRERLEVPVDHQVGPEPPHVERLPGRRARARRATAPARRARRGSRPPTRRAARATPSWSRAAARCRSATCGSASVPPCFSAMPRRAGSSSQSSRAARPTRSEHQASASSPARVAVSSLLSRTGTSAGPAGSSTTSGSRSRCGEPDAAVDGRGPGAEQDGVLARRDRLAGAVDEHPPTVAARPRRVDRHRVERAPRERLHRVDGEGGDERHGRTLTTTACDRSRRTACTLPASTRSDEIDTERLVAADRNVVDVRYNGEQPSSRRPGAARRSADVRPLGARGIRLAG